MLENSRRYIKRVWRVPQDRGPAEYLAALIVKALVKHGWPAVWDFCQLPGEPDAFEIKHKFEPDMPPVDFLEAVEIACRIICRTYRVDATQHRGFVNLNRPYRVGPGGHFREIKHDLPREI